jgi:hypothetical protein
MSLKMISATIISLSVLYCLTANGATEDETAAQACDLTERAWSAYNSQKELDKSWYEDNRIPFALRSKEQVAVYLFLEAARLDPESSAAYYNLGVFFLDKDCERSKHYFEKHQEVIPGEEDTLALLAEIKRCGCECAHYLLATGELTPSDKIFFIEESRKDKKLKKVIEQDNSN